MTGRPYSRALVLGLGVSGMAASRLLMSEGTRVVAADQKDTDELRQKARQLERAGARVILGCQALPRERFDACILSPGIRAEGPWVKVLERRGVEVLSELELGARRCECPMLAVTGSKGKSTFVKLCAEALALAGRRVEIAGNYGPPLCGLAGQSSGLDWVVVEVSSFQLERVRTFHPRVAVLLNILPDHLDRHGSLRAYRTVKSRIFRRMGGRDAGIVLDREMAKVQRLCPGKPRWLSFGTSKGAAFRYEGGAIRYRGGAVALAGTLFGNEILGVAAAGAAAAMRGCGAPPEMIGKAARGFKPLPHRMQEVGRKDGVRFVNDSKATNLAALAAGVTMCGAPVRLIAGGQLKETELRFVKKHLAKHVRGVYLIGEAAKKMRKAWAGVVPCVPCGRLEVAMKKAWKDSRAGETILLSPGCASFDQFRNFEERGRLFAACAGRITT